MKKDLHFVDLFAGCGGLSLGLEKAGFKPVMVNELNNDALNTYLLNRINEFPYLSKKPFFSNDIKDLVLNKSELKDLKDGLENFHKISTDPKKGKPLDLLVGGPPCQGYSGIGHRRSYSVEKQQLVTNHLYEDMAYMINQLQPNIFIFENVRGLINSKWTSKGQKGEIWEDVKKTFRNIKGYSVRSKLIYSKDYGVPQNRPRVFLVGIKNSLNFNFNENNYANGLLPDPSEYSIKPPNLNELLSDLIDPNYINGGKTETYPHEPLSEIQKELRTDKEGHVFGRGEKITEHEFSNHKNHVVHKFDFMIKNNGLIPEKYKTKKFSQRLLKPEWGDSGPNITATSLTDDYVHWSQPRTLTVREWARLQTFPDWYQFKGKRTTGGIRRAGNPRESINYREVPKYTQIGNAVPVQLAYIIGLHLKKILKN